MQFHSIFPVMMSIEKERERAKWQKSLFFLLRGFFMQAVEWKHKSLKPLKGNRDSSQ
jgi:hypothetical protein